MYKNAHPHLDKNTAFSALFQKRKTNQQVEYISKSRTIACVHNMWKDGDLRNAPENRRTVWTKARKEQYIKSVLECSAPLDFLVLQQTRDDESKYWDIHDGANRLTAMMEFMMGEVSVPIHPAVEYDFEHLHARAKKNFLTTDLNFVTLVNCSKAMACEIADHRNNGTPMSTGERLGHMRFLDTARSNLLFEIEDASTFVSIHNDRSAGRRMIGNLIKTLDNQNTSVRWKSCTTGELLPYFQSDDELAMTEERARLLVAAFECISDLCPEGNMPSQVIGTMVTGKIKTNNLAPYFYASCAAVAVAHVLYGTPISVDMIVEACKEALNKQIGNPAAVDGAVQRVRALTPDADNAGHEELEQVVDLGSDSDTGDNAAFG